MKIEQILKQFLLPAKDYIYGFADMDGLLHDQYAGYRYGISIGRRLDSYIVDELMDGPTIEYYDHYIQINKDLQLLGDQMAEALNNAAVDCIAIKPTVTTEELDTVYSQSLTYPISHKMVATRAGLGWIGKTDLFISHEFGPRLRLMTLLTKQQLAKGQTPIDESLCGNCSICVDECPAEAATGELWDISKNRDQFFDPHKCRQQCRDFGEKKLKRDIRICGICVAMCPYG